MARRIALLIGTSDYAADPGLRQLVAPAQDTARLARLLADPQIGGFETRVLNNEKAAAVREAVEELLVDCLPDDLALLYFSGHGVKDYHDGHLYLALTNTRLRLLESTAVSADFINKVMLRSPSRQQVLVLDCCYSGAFARGMRVKAGEAVNTREYFTGQGRAILTASDAMQYALEGETATGQGVQSVFTRLLADGLESGAADMDGDGQVDLEELYDYVLRRMAEEAPTQKPNKVFALSGKLYLARNPKPPPPKPAPLPAGIAEALADPRPFVRVGAVDELARLLRGKDAGQALAARQVLEQLRDDDDQARRVSEAAGRALESLALPDSARPAVDAPKPAPAPAAPPPKPGQERLKLTVPFEMELIRIPAGEFLMGSDKAKDKDAYDDELPQHKVMVPEFYIARLPVTVAQFGAFVKQANYVTLAEKDGYGWVWNKKGGSDAKWDKTDGANWQHPWGPRSDVAQKQAHPVTQMSLKDARAFVAWLMHAAAGQLPAGWQFRLPTEAEWEKAARGTDGWLFPWGPAEPDKTYCNFNANVGDTTPVGQYSPKGDSPYGVADMAGNVWEWTESLWGKDLNKPEFRYPYRPGDKREDQNAPDAVHRVVRGGSFYHDRRYVRCTSRNHDVPDGRSVSGGFRVVGVVSPLGGLTPDP